MQAVVITIGDEILNGTTIDTNGAFLGRELAAIGLQMLEKISITDQSDHICETLDRYVGHVPVILLTGGLGPTKDDLTKHTLNQYFGGTLKQDRNVLQFIEDRFRKRGVTMTDRNLEQALVPDICTVIPNNRGTAPGMLFESNGSMVFSMPGVPFEMKAMFTDGIAPILKERLDLPVIMHHHIMTSGIGESWLADKIHDIEESLPSHITLAYLPSPGVVKLRLTGRGKSFIPLNEEVTTYGKHLVERIGPYVYGYDEESLAAAIGRRLLALNSTLSVAESCTGGNIGHLITSIPGSSAYFLGSIVSYDYRIKEKVLGVHADTLQRYGAVSTETVTEMLSGVQLSLGGDYSIAVSGIAGPGGGTKEKPLGTVYVGVTGPGSIEVERYTFGQDRAINIEYSSMFALHMLRVLLDNHLEKQGISA